MSRAGRINPRKLWMALSLPALVTACNLASNTPDSIPILTLVPTQAATAFPSAVPTPTRMKLIVRGRSQPVNCRFGPGVVYSVVGGLRANQNTLAEGRNFDATWLYIHDPGNPGGLCWLAASAVDVEGDVDNLSELSAPVAYVTGLRVRAEPQRITVTCQDFPQFIHLAGEITTNGPLVIRWHWELSTGEVTPEETLTFEQSGTRTVERTQLVSAPNDYRVRLHAFDPGENIAQADYFATCTP